MVDLAKIRKKAKKVLGGESSGESSSSRVLESSSEQGESSSLQVVESSSGQGGESSSDAPQVRPGEPAPTDVSTTRRPEDSTTRTLDDADPTTKLERFKREAGKRRQFAETATEEEAAPEARLELLTFTIAGEHYAVDIDRIVEIVTPRAITRIPNADPSVVGIVSLRGTIVTLVDVRRKLRHPAGTATADTRVVVIDFRNETVGFVVDRVQRVVKLAATAVEPHPVVHSAELEESIRGVFRVSGALTILLDLDKLLDHTPWT